MKSSQAPKFSGTTFNLLPVRPASSIIFKPKQIPPTSSSEKHQSSSTTPSSSATPPPSSARQPKKSNIENIVKKISTTCKPQPLSSTQLSNSKYRNNNQNARKVLSPSSSSSSSPSTSQQSNAAPNVQVTQPDPNTIQKTNKVIAFSGCPHSSTMNSLNKSAPSEPPTVSDSTTISTILPFKHTSPAVSKKSKTSSATVSKASTLSKEVLSSKPISLSKRTMNTNKIEESSPRKKANFSTNVATLKTSTGNEVVVIVDSDEEDFNAPRIPSNGVETPKVLLTDVCRDPNAASSIKSVLNISGASSMNSITVSSAPVKKTISKKMKIKMLEKKLEKLEKMINKFAEEEVSLLEMDREECAYIQESKLKEEFLREWKKYCRLIGDDPDEYISARKKVKVRSAPFPEINREVEKYINRNGSFPNVFDIKTVCIQANNKHNLEIKDVDLQNIAIDVFTEVGQKLQKTREKDLRAYSGNALTDLALKIPDPAIEDQDLKLKLKRNKKIAKKKTEDVFNDYVRQQYEQMRAGDTNTNESSDDEDNDMETLRRKNLIENKKVKQKLIKNKASGGSSREPTAKKLKRIENTTVINVTLSSQEELVKNNKKKIDCLVTVNASSPKYMSSASPQQPQSPIASPRTSLPLSHLSAAKNQTISTNNQGHSSSPKPSKKKLSLSANKPLSTHTLTSANIVQQKQSMVCSVSKKPAESSLSNINKATSQPSLGPLKQLTPSSPPSQKMPLKDSKQIPTKVSQKTLSIFQSPLSNPKHTTFANSNTNSNFNTNKNFNTNNNSSIDANKTSTQEAGDFPGFATTTIKKLEQVSRTPIGKITPLHTTLPKSSSDVKPNTTNCDYVSPLKRFRSLTTAVGGGPPSSSKVVENRLTAAKSYVHQDRIVIDDSDDDE